MDGIFLKSTGQLAGERRGTSTLKGEIAALATSDKLGNPLPDQLVVITDLEIPEGQTATLVRGVVTFIDTPLTALEQTARDLRSKLNDDSITFEELKELLRVE
jgi:hypothetical protein